MSVETRTRPGLELAWLTDIGCARENNEDNCGYWESADDSEFEKRGRLAVVADGMGGYEGGQEASQMAVDTVIEVYSSSPVVDPQVALIDSLHAAHARIRRYSSAHDELYGMGTTCTAAVLLGHQLYFAHVGDSRLYRVRGPEIRRLTQDHSYVGRLVANGMLTPEDAEHHPQRNILTAALGAGDELLPDFPEPAIATNEGDIFVLCTDGLWSMVSESEIQQAVSEMSPAEACAHLVQKARLRGGPDNITLQVLKAAGAS
jgi:protein phosphatase